MSNSIISSFLIYTATEKAEPLRFIADGSKAMGAVFGAVGLVMLVAITVLAIVWIKRRRRRRAELPSDEPPPRYDTSVTPFPIPTSEAHGRRVPSVVARLLNKMKRSEQTNQWLGTVGRTPISETASLSDPPPYSERPTSSRTATAHSPSLHCEGQRMLGSDSKRLVN